MIWTGGQILHDHELSISVLDRTFEHGLGLFETLRTWGGRPTLLDRHQARMLKSAEALNLSIDPSSLPDAEAVRMLLEAEGIAEDRILRITASGGTASGKSVVWMRSNALPEPVGEGGASLLLGSWEVAHEGPMARHKSLNYWSRRLAFEEARRRGFDEALSGTSSPSGMDEIYYYEGSRTNLFLVFDDGVGVGIGPLRSRRPELYTTSTEGQIVPGIIREVVLEIARELSIPVSQERHGIDASSIGRLEEVFLTNSVRGIIPVGRAAHAAFGLEYRWLAPGPVTLRLQESLARRLWPDLKEAS